MALSIVEQIARAIKDRVAGVAGVTVVRPSRLGGITPATNLIVLVQDNPLPNEEHSYPGNPGATAWDQPFLLALFNRASDKDTTPADENLNALRASVEAAVCTPLATWHTWGGLAIQSRWGEPAGFETDEPGVSIVTLQLDVTYRTPENDPYTAR